MATDVTGVEDVMGEVAHFWQLRKFQFIEEATDFWMNAVAPKECFGDEDPDLDTTLLLNQFFTEWLLFEMPYQESTLVGITALRDEISAESRNVLKQIAETQRFSSFKMQWLNPDTSMVQLRDVYSGKCYIVESAHLADKAGWLEGTVSCRIAYVDGGWCCPGQVFLHDGADWNEVDQSNYVSADTYGYYVGLCREVLGRDGKYRKSLAPKCDEDLLEDPAVRDELLARRGYAKEIRNRYASAVPDYGEDNVRAAGQAGTHSVQHPVIESGRTREQSDRNVEH